MKQMLAAAVILLFVLAAIWGADCLYRSGRRAPEAKEAPASTASGPTVDNSGIDWRQVRSAAFPVAAVAVAIFLIFLLRTKSYNIHAAAEKGDADEVAAILDKQPDLVNAVRSGSGMTPLHVAARCGRIDAAKLLIARGADLDAKDADDRTALYYASAWGYREIVEMLLAAGVGVTADGPEDVQPIAAAEYWKHPEIAELLRARVQTSQENEPT